MSRLNLTRGVRRLIADQQGAMVVWSLGFVLMLFFAGGVALDLWRVLSQHGTAAAIADKAAVAGAGQIDQQALRQGQLRLAPQPAEQAARQFARRQPGWDPTSMTVEATAQGSRITVRVSEVVQLTLLQMFVPPQGITVTAASVASPQWAG